MGYIYVNSPHDNNPVKVLEKDIGRAVKDNEGRTFYVLPKSDGSGYFGAFSRADAAKEEADALHRESQEQRAAEAAAAPVHVVGHSQRSGGKMLILLILLALIAGGIYLWYSGVFS